MRINCQVILKGYSKNKTKGKLLVKFEFKSSTYVRDTKQVPKFSSLTPGELRYYCCLKALNSFSIQKRT